MVSAIRKKLGIRTRLKRARDSISWWANKAPYFYGLRSAKQVPLPDFLGIGGQKCGTTWLYENLRRHPQLYLPDQKEIHYFNLYFYRSLRWYSKKFELGTGKIKGEVTPDYGSIPQWQIRFIRKVMPNVKPILLIRNPVDRAWSHAYKNLVAIPGRRLSDVSESMFIHHFDSKLSKMKGDFIHMLDSWLSVFPSEQLFVGFFDDVKNRPRKLLCNIFRHLGVSEDMNWEAFSPETVVLPRYSQDCVAGGYQAKNYQSPNKFMSERLREYLYSMYKDDIDELCKRYGGCIKEWRRV